MTPYESVLLHLAAKFPSKIQEASRNGTLMATFPGTTKPFLDRAVQLAEHVIQRRAEAATDSIQRVATSPQDQGGRTHTH